MRQKACWSEIKADFDELDGFESNDDIVKCVSVDAWISDAPDAAGEVIAKIILTKSGDVGVIYIDGLAHSNEMVQEIIQDALRKIKD